MSTALDPTWIGACQQCIAGAHGVVEGGTCVCCGTVVEVAQ